MRRHIFYSEGAIHSFAGGEGEWKGRMKKEKLHFRDFMSKFAIIYGPDKQEILQNQRGVRDDGASDVDTAILGDTVSGHKPAPQ